MPFRRTGIFSMICLTLFLCCGATAPQTCNNTGNDHIGPTGGQIAAVAVVIGAVVVGTVVLVHVHNSHHRVKGCLVANGASFEVENQADQKTYILTGATDKLKVGDLVKVHGDRVKQKKGDTGNQTFVVQQINKDYGPCKVPPAHA